MPTAVSYPAKSSSSSPFEIPTLIRVDPSSPGQDQSSIHTRWHPDIPSVATIEVGKPFKVECLDYSGGQVHNDDSADDVLHLDHDSDHHLSGPLFVPGAMPGDALEIEILDVVPHASQPWGYCMTTPGLGSLDHPNYETKITKSIWDFHGSSTSSRHIPGVSFQGRAHPGVIGTAPSRELLAEWTRRETECPAGSMTCDLPLENGAYVGQDLPDELRERIYREGARTSPGREHGGNIDIASLTRGSRVYLPVCVPGAKLSVGDLHFSEGDGEPTTAIEMAGIVTLRVNIVKRGVETLSLASPMYQTSPSETLYLNRLVFTGLSTDLSGNQTERSGLTAYRNAAFSAIKYLESFGYTREQAYMMLSCLPVETKVIATANKPNMMIGLGLPVDAFQFDILPRNAGYRLTENSGPALISGGYQAPNGHAH